MCANRLNEASSKRLPSRCTARERCSSSTISSTSPRPPSMLPSCSIAPRTSTCSRRAAGPPTLERARPPARAPLCGQRRHTVRRAGRGARRYLAPTRSRQCTRSAVASTGCPWRSSSWPPASSFSTVGDHAGLDEGLALEMEGPVDLPERQRTLRAAIDWSYKLLNERQRTLHGALAVFADGGRLEDARAISGSGPEFLRDLEALVAWSLVRSEVTDGQVRLSMLETVREHTRSEHTLDVFRQRHAKRSSSSLSTQRTSFPAWNRPVGSPCSRSNSTTSEPRSIGCLPRIESRTRCA